MEKEQGITWKEKKTARDALTNQKANSVYAFPKEAMFEGNLLRTQDGRVYRVAPDGSLRRVKEGKKKP